MRREKTSSGAARAPVLYASAKSVCNAGFQRHEHSQSYGGGVSGYLAIPAGPHTAGCRCKSPSGTAARAPPSLAGHFFPKAEEHIHALLIRNPDSGQIELYPSYFPLSLCRSITGLNLGTLGVRTKGRGEWILYDHPDVCAEQRLPGYLRWGSLGVFSARFLGSGPSVRQRFSISRSTFDDWTIRLGLGREISSALLPDRAICYTELDFHSRRASLV